MRDLMRRVTVLIRRGVAVAVLLAAADPSLPPSVRLQLLDALAGPDAEPISPRRPGL
ncbi:hypothetical protein ABZ570_23710 [Micromonospora sp. NPDC007271]|uniref:hypothetical protein n=1 Tax=Micromonospora sp. NPDC007271 TaxID=3154587 RepID=UPI0033D595E8